MAVSSLNSSTSLCDSDTCYGSFPIQEFGMNYESQPLQRHELAAMKANSEIVARVLRSYRLMLDFYGMDLCSPETGLLRRAEPESKNKERYRNLVRK